MYVTIIFGVFSLQYFFIQWLYVNNFEIMLIGPEVKQRSYEICFYIQQTLYIVHNLYQISISFAICSKYDKNL